MNESTTPSTNSIKPFNETKSTPAGFADLIREANIDDLRKQNLALLEENEALRKIVSSIPRLILEARLDAKEGRPTKLNLILP